MNRKILFASLASAFLASAASATPLTPSVLSVGGVGFYNASTNNPVGALACSNLSTAGATIGCSGSTPSPTTGGTLNYLTTATAGYGTLKAAGQSSISGASGTANLTDYSSSYGQASFEDSWTITGGTGTGTLALQFALDGTYNFCNIHSGETLGFSLVNLDNSSFSSGTPALTSCSGTIGNTVTLTTNFVFGTPLDFLVSLLAGSNLYDLGNNITSNIDFSDTAQMSAIIVTDASGDVVPFDLTTASGGALFSRLAPGAPPPPAGSVPEPVSVSLFGAGLAGAAALRRRKKTV